MKYLWCIVVLLLALSMDTSNGQQQQQAEVFLGTIFPLSHGVSGKVYAIDDRTIRIKNLNYDGQAPDAYFWVGSTDRPGVTGTPIPDENGSTAPLSRPYRNANVVLRLPSGMTLRDIKHIGLWCRKFQENFGFTRINVV